MAHLTTISNWAWPHESRPRVCIAGRFQLRAEGFEYTYCSPTHALHLHDYYGTLRLGEHAYDLSPGTLTVSPAYQPSQYDLPTPGTHWCIHFSPACTNDSSMINIPWMTRLGPRRIEAESRFAHIARSKSYADSQNGSNDAVSSLTADIATHDLLMWIALLGVPGHARIANSHPAVDKVLEIVDHELDRPLSVPELARRSGLSQNVLARHFKQYTGMTLPHHILTCRITAAQLLLVSTDLPIKTIAARVGIPDPHHFNKQFRRLAGQSPTSARQEARTGVLDFK